MLDFFFRGEDGGCATESEIKFFPVFCSVREMHTNAFSKEFNIKYIFANLLNFRDKEKRDVINSPHRKKTDHIA